MFSNRRIPLFIRESYYYDSKAVLLWDFGERTQKSELRMESKKACFLAEMKNKKGTSGANTPLE